MQFNGITYKLNDFTDHCPVDVAECISSCPICHRAITEDDLLCLGRYEMAGYSVYCFIPDYCGKWLERQSFKVK